VLKGAEVQRLASWALELLHGIGEASCLRLSGEFGCDEIDDAAKVGVDGPGVCIR